MRCKHFSSTGIDEFWTCVLGLWCDPPALAKVTYFVGFDWESRSAWRLPASDKDAIKEFTSDLRPTTAQPNDPVRAFWKDGWSHVVEDISNKDLKGMLETKKMERVERYTRRLSEKADASKCDGKPKKAGARAETAMKGGSHATEIGKTGSIWRGKLDGASLSVVMRVDHTRKDGSKTRIASIFFRGKQCCQVPLSAYPAHLHEPLTKAMVMLAEELASGSTTIEKTKTRRDEIFHAKGFFKSARPKKAESADHRALPPRTPEEPAVSADVLAQDRADGVRTPSPKRPRRTVVEPQFDDPEESMFDM